MLKRIYSLLIALVLILIPLQSDAKVYKKSTATIKKNVVITINGEVVPFKAAIVDGSTYMPLRIMAYALNSTVSWDANTRTIGIYTKNERVPEVDAKDLKYFTGKKTAKFVDDMRVYVNGNKAPTVEKQMCVIDNRTFIPLRSLTLLTDVRVTYDEKANSINIVNPRLMKIDKKVSARDKDYYVYDLPTVKDESDLMVGNWKGYDVFTNDETIDFFIIKTTSTYHITKEADDTYTVIVHATFDNEIFQDGKYVDIDKISDYNIVNKFNEKYKNKGFALKYTGIEYNKSTKELELRKDKCTVVQSDVGNIIGANIGPTIYGDYLRAVYNNGSYSYLTRY